MSNRTKQATVVACSIGMWVCIGLALLSRPATAADAKKDAGVYVDAGSSSGDAGPSLMNINKVWPHGTPKFSQGYDWPQHWSPGDKVMSLRMGSQEVAYCQYVDGGIGQGFQRYPDGGWFQNDLVCFFHSW